jgi:hypothetical protein
VDSHTIPPHALHTHTHTHTHLNVRVLIPSEGIRSCFASERERPALRATAPQQHDGTDALVHTTLFFSTEMFDLVQSAAYLTHTQSRAVVQQQSGIVRMSFFCLACSYAKEQRLLVVLLSILTQRMSQLKNLTAIICGCSRSPIEFKSRTSRCYVGEITLLLVIRVELIPLARASKVVLLSPAHVLV